MLYKHLRTAIVMACTLCIYTANAQVQVKEPTGGDPNWTKDYEPFRIIDNLYYVGSYDLGMYLITTPAGHILINTGLASSAAMIQRHVEKLGFKMSDIKILLTNQAHFDHMGGMAAVKKLTGAKMMVMDGDVEVAESGGSSDYVLGKYGVTFEPVKVDRILHDGDEIALGDFKIKVLKHPGHTRGSCSYIFNAFYKKAIYRVLIANMPKMLPEVNPAGMEGYADVGKDFEHTYNVMPKLPFDLWVAAHASQFGLHKKHKPGAACNPDAFCDRKSYEATIEELHQEYLEKRKSVR